MDRRGFLKGLLGGTVAVMAAPAIVRAESLMKIRPSGFVIWDDPVLAPGNFPHRPHWHSAWGPDPYAADFDGDAISFRVIIDETALQQTDENRVSQRRRKQTLDTTFYNQVYEIPLRSPKNISLVTTHRQFGSVEVSEPTNENKLILPKARRIIPTVTKIFC